jgi:hypothetical protein
VQTEDGGDGAVQLATMFDAAGAAVCSSVVVMGGVPASQHASFSAAVLDFAESHAGDGESDRASPSRSPPVASRSRITAPSHRLSTLV